MQFRQNYPRRQYMSDSCYIRCKIWRSLCVLLSILKRWEVKAHGTAVGFLRTTSTVSSPAHQSAIVRGHIQSLSVSTLRSSGFGWPLLHMGTYLPLAGVSATTRAGIPLLALGSCMYNGASSEVKMLKNLGHPHCVDQAPSFTLIAPGCCEHGACMPQICYYSYTHKHCWSQPTPASWRCRNKGQTLPMLVPPCDPKALKCALVINTRTAEKMDRVSTIGMLGP